MRLSNPSSPELDSRIVCVDGWSPAGGGEGEETIIVDIMATEHVERFEAIRRMRRRRLDDLRGRTWTLAAGRGSLT